MESILVHDSQTIFFSDVGFVKHEANFCLTTIPEKSNGDVFCCWWWHNQDDDDLDHDFHMMDFDYFDGGEDDNHDDSGDNFDWLHCYS